jgi:RNA polymerase sigma-70 factor (ECF subfamily)
MKTTSRAEEQDLRALLAADLDMHFESLMIAYQDRLYAFTLRLSGNAQDAEEIVQDAFVRAYRALRTYSGERIAGLALPAWLYQISLNVFRNKVRGKRLDTVSIDQESEEGSGQEPADHERRTPEAVLLQSELQAELAALVAAMPERYQAAVVLRYVEGLSYAELAEVVRQPVGTVKANVHRGIQWLREASLQHEVRGEL